MHGSFGRQRHRDCMVFGKFQFDELLFDPKFSTVSTCICRIPCWYNMKFFVAHQYVSFGFVEGNGKVDSNFLLLERFDWIGLDLFGKFVVLAFCCLFLLTPSYFLFQTTARTNRKCIGAYHIKATCSEIPRIQRSGMDEPSDCKLCCIRVDLFLFQFFRFKHTNTKRSHVDWSTLSCYRGSFFYSCHDWLVHTCETSDVNATKKE